MATTQCIYCKSRSYGRNCAFAPHKTHVHMGDATKCIYCGSKSVGSSCSFNPHGKMHIMGIEYNSMIRDSIEKGITMGYLRNVLLQPITEMRAYELGIIDSYGCKVRNPETLEERSAYGPLEEYVLSLRKLVGKDLDLLYNSMDIKLESVISNEDYAVMYESELKIKDKFSEAGNLFHEAVSSAYQSGLSTAAIEKMIVESILENEKS